MKNTYENTKEHVQHKKNTNLRIFVNRVHADFAPHWHTDIEIIFPKQAPYKVLCGTRTYQVEVGDILLICPAVMHEIISVSPGPRLYIQADFSGITALKEIDKAFRMMSPALHIKKDSCPADIYAQLSSYLHKATKIYFGKMPTFDYNNGKDNPEDSYSALTELEPFDELEIYSVLMQFIAFCGKNLNLFQKSNMSSTMNQKNFHALSNVCNYISAHFTENLSLESIATYAGFSKYHFERVFSEYTGETFYQYLQQMRIKYAQTLLSNPDMSVTDIAYQSGFTSSTAFTRAFKKSTGYPPSEYRAFNKP